MNFIKKLLHKWQDKRTARKNKLEKQRPDSRDHKYTASTATPKKRVDLRPYFQKTRRQGNANACTAFATTALLEYKMTRIRGLMNEYYLSPLYNWY